jgi:FlaA1/EpsC-like NDP-sugar epimerase
MIPIIQGHVEFNPIVREDLVQICSAPLPWEKFHKKTVTVTGGGGFLASYLIKAILAASRTKNAQ